MCVFYLIFFFFLNKRIKPRASDLRIQLGAQLAFSELRISLIALNFLHLTLERRVKFARVFPKN